MWHKAATASPETVIRQRFAKSADYFERHYKGIVDEWYVWDSLDGAFRQAEAWERLMGKVIDVHEVQDELSRAARDAKHGSRDVRAGRFVAGAASASQPKGEPGPTRRVGGAARKTQRGPADGRAGRMVPIESSLMMGVKYDEKARELDIRFTSGKTYRYFDVPKNVYRRLLGAKSKGEFFNEEIKEIYQYAEMRGRRR